jgi:hypothetical protein
MGLIFKIPGMIIYIIAGLWGLILCLGIISDNLGYIAGAIALLLLPATLTLAPWYEALANANWYPLVVVYGGGLTGSILFALGTAIDG